MGKTGKRGNNQTISKHDGGHGLRLSKSGKSRKSRERKRRKPLKRQQPERKEKYRDCQCRANRKQHQKLSKLSARHDTQRQTPTPLWQYRHRHYRHGLPVSIDLAPQCRSIAKFHAASFSLFVSVIWSLMTISNFHCANVLQIIRQQIRMQCQSPNIGFAQ